MKQARTSVAATRPAASRLTKPRLFSDSTGPTAAYLIGVATLTWSQLSVDSSRFFLGGFFFFPKFHPSGWIKKEERFSHLLQLWQKTFFKPFSTPKNKTNTCNFPD